MALLIPLLTSRPPSSELGEWATKIEQLGRHTDALTRLGKEIKKYAPLNQILTAPSRGPGGGLSRDVSTGTSLTRGRGEGRSSTQGSTPPRVTSLGCPQDLVGSAATPGGRDSPSLVNSGAPLGVASLSSSPATCFRPRGE
jgi:hypothetical protein